jgi:penicillin amidase
MVEAVQEIENDVSRISGRWKWSKVHKVTYRHSLGRVTLLDKLFGFNVGPFPSGGSSATVNKGQYMHLSGYAQRVGPSMRRIVDFADLNSTQFILPTGQSGNPFSKHYKDQAEMFLDGSFKTTHFDEDFIRESHDYQRMVLMPADQ